MKQNLNSEKQINEELLDFDTSNVMDYCDKCDFEYDELDAVKSHKELYHENNCDTCGEDF